MPNQHNFPECFACPACGAEVEVDPASFTCAECARVYPVIAGIPDFRLRSDPYLGLEQEREKALRLSEKSASGFSAMLDYYYQITDDVTASLAIRYKAYHHNSINQARYGLEALSLSSDDRLLDAGCGTGGALIAASDITSNIVGVDIALRWLVMCKQRLLEHGVQATLVCADVEALPFHKRGFTRILASDLLESVYSVDDTLGSLRDQLVNEGTMWISANNQYCIGPHPSTRMWAIGYLPARSRGFLLRILRGVDSSRLINLVSPRDLVRRAKKQGLIPLRLSPKMIQQNNIKDYPVFDRFLIDLYVKCNRIGFFRKILLLVGPAFELLLCRTRKNHH